MVALRLAVYNHSVFATSPLRLTTSNFIFQLNICGYSPYVTSSLTKGLVCHLQLLLVILKSESRGIHDHVLLSQIQVSPNLEGQVAVFISPRNRVARLYPQAFGSLFVASYESQDYGGGIRPLLHTGELTTSTCRPYFCAPYITEVASAPHSDCASVSTSRHAFYQFIPRPHLYGKRLVCFPGTTTTNIRNERVWSHGNLRAIRSHYQWEFSINLRAGILGDAS
jgi:hypothetical protein